MLAETVANSAATDAPHGGFGTVAALVLFIAASVWIAVVANRAMQKGSFLKGFFLGNRGLGAWALALTATVQSGGTFMGFPSTVYSHGWVVALWIASYMVVPITGFAIIGKRMAHLSRRTGAITVPDMFRERFGSPALGIVASLFILFFMTVMMIGQFKAGALVMKNSLPGTKVLSFAEDFPPQVEGEKSTVAKEKGPETPQERRARKGLDNAYYLGLIVFTLTVVGYTLMGGFLAAVWTDLFQSVMMLVGVVLLLFLTLSATQAQVGNMEQTSLAAVSQTGPEYLFGPGYTAAEGAREFLPLAGAVSFIFVWIFSGLGSPAGTVRVMASKNTETIRRSIYLLSFYNSLIYIPLIVICICGRVLIPDLGSKSDEIIPRLALMTTQGLPLGSFIGGVILAAPFGAVMATVSGYLVVIASGIVRDVYQRFLRPHAGARELRIASSVAMVVVGAIAVGMNIDPVDYLQSIVVFSGTGTAVTFCVPTLMAAYSRRATVPGVLASMFSGSATLLGLYVVGYMGFGGKAGTFGSYNPLDLHPIIWGLCASLMAGLIVNEVTTPPDPVLVSKLFDAESPKTEPISL